MSKFKKGDKVRILPSAMDVSVLEVAIGKTGVITRYSSSDSIIVRMDKSRRLDGYRDIWSVSSSQIEPVIKVGQQLLLWEWV